MTRSEYADAAEALGHAYLSICMAEHGLESLQADKVRAVRAEIEQLRTTVGHLMVAVCRLAQQ